MSTMEKPVPSVTLSITKDDAKRVLDASKAIKESLLKLQQQTVTSATCSGTPSAVAKLADKKTENGQTPRTEKPSSTPVRKVSTSDSSAASPESTSKASAERRSGNRPLHEMVYEAANACDHPLVRSFFDKMKTAGATPEESRAGVLLFHDMEMEAKLRLVFDVLGGGSRISTGSTTSGEGNNDKENCERSLTHEGALSLFRSIILAIDCCVHRGTKIEIEIEKESELQERPTKKARIEQHHSPKSQCTSTSNDAHSVPTLQSASPSFDSSLATSKDEDDVDAVRKEFEEIAIYAADRLEEFANNGPPDAAATSDTDKATSTITFDSFNRWRSAEGLDIVPWLELMNLSKWQTPRRATADSLALPPLSKPAERKSNEKVSPVKVPEIETKKEVEAEGLLPQDVPMPPSPHLEPPSPTFYTPDHSTRTVVSFDFTGSVPAADAPADPSAFCISITEENLWTLRTLVDTTGLSSRQTSDISSVIQDAARSRKVGSEDFMVLGVDGFRRCLDEFMRDSPKDMSKLDRDVFSSCFVDFFSCFDCTNGKLKHGEVDAKDLAVGFCFLCSGNKSTKLNAGFEIMMEKTRKSGGLTGEELTQFLQSYLTMLVGISLLASSPEGIMKPKLSPERRKEMFIAVEHGAKWTYGHFLKTIGKSESFDSQDKFTFETFAGWYTAGGYNVAPWLELLDLKKLLSLVGNHSEWNSKSPQTPAHDPLPPFPGTASKSNTPKYHSPRARRGHPPVDPFAAPAPAGPPPAEVLFTFPLANRRSLVVLREDAVYVKSVVEQLGLLSQSPDDVWSSLFNIAMKRQGKKANTKNNRAAGKGMQVSKAVFVEYMQATIDGTASSKKRGSSGLSKAAMGARDVLVNFFHSFDLHQVDHVALNELMGGLTLLCGGKKSTKLAFAFGVFDRRVPPKGKKGKKAAPMLNSLGGEDLFLFLRSFLIVMFSCCRQSWDLSDDAVGRYIADTANMVTEDVMRYQWTTRKRDRVDFDEFGEWYNEGGFETAPWLELLDLKKWVLNENTEAAMSSAGVRAHASPEGVASTQREREDFDCPPPPPEDSVDPSFFVDDDNAIMPLDSIDEMDILLMQQTSQDGKENDMMELNKLSRSFSYSSPRQPQPRSSNSLKFQLVTEDEHGGYMVCVSQKRIHHLRHILMESGIHKINGEAACKQILGKSRQTGRSNRTKTWTLTKDDFDSAMRGVITSSAMSVETQRTLSDILSGIFKAFDHDRNGTVNALEVACGFTVLCQGKKSDKLEFAFEVLDKEKKGTLSRADTSRYLRSFLTVLLNLASSVALDSDPTEDVMTTLNGSRCDYSESSLVRAVEAGSSWAAAQAFKTRRPSEDVISFDEFAEWYTHVGYSNIPWLELLDLHKWVVMDT